MRSHSARPILGQTAPQPESKPLRYQAPAYVPRSVSPLSNEDHERMRVLSKQLRNNEISPNSNEAKELVRLSSKPLSASKNLFPICPRCSYPHFGPCPVKIITASQAIQKFLPETTEDSTTIPSTPQRSLQIASPSPSPPPFTPLDKTQSFMYNALEHHRKQLAALDINPTPVIVNPAQITESDSANPPVTTSSTQLTTSQPTQAITTQANEPMDTQSSASFQRFIFPGSQPLRPAVIPFSQPQATFIMPSQPPPFQPVSDTHPFAYSEPASSSIPYQLPLQHRPLAPQYEFEDYDTRPYEEEVLSPHDPDLFEYNNTWYSRTAIQNQMAQGQTIEYGLAQAAYPNRFQLPPQSMFQPRQHQQFQPESFSSSSTFPSTQQTASRVLTIRPPPGLAVSSETTTASQTPPRTISRDPASQPLSFAQSQEISNIHQAVEHTHRMGSETQAPPTSTTEIRAQQMYTYANVRSIMADLLKQQQEQFMKQQQEFLTSIAAQLNRAPPILPSISQTAQGLAQTVPAIETETAQRRQTESRHRREQERESQDRSRQYQPHRQREVFSSDLSSDRDSPQKRPSTDYGYRQSSLSKTRRYDQSALTDTHAHPSW